ncbi:DNA-binding protein [Mucilaginibacter terrae]|uniref:DNA-binding protein n=1 Tax=Mucilaginibacter terrae TaxID=1955052 RepID=UPI003632F22F
MNVICIDDAAFYELFDRLVVRLEGNKAVKEDKWISGIEAMNMMRIKSKTTLQKLRDEGQIRYTQPEKKIILYDRDSINDFLEDFVQEPFEQWKKK